MVDAAEWVLDRIEAHVRGPVLVFGSLPPEGRDLDLLVRETEEGALTDGLARDGLQRRGHRWAVFRNCSAYRVEVVAASDWGLAGNRVGGAVRTGSSAGRAAACRSTRAAPRAS